MSSYEHDPQTRGGQPNVTITAEDGAGEISVVDGRFQEVARGLGQVELMLPPGIYRARSAVGQTFQDHLFSVANDSPSQRISLEPLVFETPIPIEGTRTRHEYQIDAMVRASDVPQTDLGQGGEIVVFIRDPGSDYIDFSDDQIAEYTQSFSGFSLVTADGMEADLMEHGEINPKQGRLLFRASVAPGTCVLAGPSYEGERVCLPLVVLPHQSIQVFILLESDTPGLLRRWPDMNGASIVFQYTGGGFDPFRGDLRVYEAARKALAKGSNRLGAAGMRQLLYEKFDNPMLGLVVAHLILLRKNPNLDLLKTILGNLEPFLAPDHPDFVALGWRLADLEGDHATSRALASQIASLQNPPMLQLGWRLMQDALEVHEIHANEGPFALAGDVISSSVWMLWSLRSATLASTLQILHPLPLPAPPELGRSAPEPKVMTKPGLGGLLEGYDLSGVIGKVLSSNTVFGKTTRDVISPMLDLLKKRLQRNEQPPVKPKQEEESFAAESLLALSRRVDWAAILRQLKKMAIAKNQALSLSTRQRQLLLALKDLYELATDGDGLTKDEIKDWLAHYNIDLKAVSRDLRRVLEVADEVSRVIEAKSQGHL